MPNPNEPFITRVPVRPVTIERPKAPLTMPELQKMLPEAPIVLSIFEEIQLSITEKISLFKALAKATPTVLKLTYWILTMDFTAIARMLATIVVGWLSTKTGILPDADIAGYPLTEWIFWILLVVAGIFLPQAKHMLPEWLRKLLKWDKPEEAPK